jgi:hypothetical protein
VLNISLCLLLNNTVSRVYPVGDGIVIEYGTLGGIRFGRGNRNTCRKPIPLSYDARMSQMYQNLTFSSTADIYVIKHTP